jgi:hypothetical protein
MPLRVAPPHRFRRVVKRTRAATPAPLKPAPLTLAPPKPAMLYSGAPHRSSRPQEPDEPYGAIHILGGGAARRLDLRTPHRSSRPQEPDEPSGATHTLGGSGSREASESLGHRRVPQWQRRPRHSVMSIARQDRVAARRRHHETSWWMPARDRLYSLAHSTLSGEGAHRAEGRPNLHGHCSSSHHLIIVSLLQPRLHHSVRPGLKPGTKTLFSVVTLFAFSSLLKYSPF